jgi:hypothetical protein
MLADAPVKLTQRLLYGMEFDHLGKKIEARIALVGVGEEGDWRSAPIETSAAVLCRCLWHSDLEEKQRFLRPRENRDEGDADDQRVLDPKCHQEGRQHSATENAKPHLPPVSNKFHS